MFDHVCLSGPLMDMPRCISPNPPQAISSWCTGISVHNLYTPNPGKTLGNRETN